MTRLLAVLAAATVAFAITSSGSSAYAAETGEISEAQLAELGLGSMQTVTDAEALQIRGKGWGHWLGLLDITFNLNFNIGEVHAKNIFIVNGPLIINLGGRRHRGRR